MNGSEIKLIAPSLATNCFGSLSVLWLYQAVFFRKGRLEAPMRPSCGQEPHYWETIEAQPTAVLRAEGMSSNLFQPEVKGGRKEDLKNAVYIIFC